MAKQTIAGQSNFACAALHAGWCFLHGDGFVLNRPTGCMPLPQVVALSQARPTRSNWDAKVEIAQQRALLFLRAAAVGVCRSDFDQQFKAAHARLLMSVFHGSVHLLGLAGGIAASPGVNSEGRCKLAGSIAASNRPQ